VLRPDSGGAGRFRGGLGAERALELRRGTAVSSLRHERHETSPWGLHGGGDGARWEAVVRRAGDGEERLPGKTVFEFRAGDVLTVRTGGGGGFGDPLERDPRLVIEDIKDDYVSVARAAKDYGVVVQIVDAELCEYEVDKAATDALRSRIRRERVANVRLDPEIVAQRYRSGALDVLDVIRQHAVILDWGSGALLPESTRQFREVFERRSVANWAAD
jgi:N-methylhydantoinase B